MIKTFIRGFVTAAALAGTSFFMGWLTLEWLIRL